MTHADFTENVETETKIAMCPKERITYDAVARIMMPRTYVSAWDG